MISSDNLKGLREAVSKLFPSLPKPRLGDKDVAEDQTTPKPDDKKTAEEE